MRCFIGLVSFVFMLTINFVIGSQEEKVVICYYGTWAAYRTGLGKFEVTDIPTDLCTHVVYTFLGIDYSGNVVSLDPYLDYADNWGKDYLRKFNALKITNPSLKTILAVGGFSEGSEKYSLMASNPKLRRNFITTSLNILTKYGFDGLEIDWEYPNRGDSIYGQGDVDNFSQLLKELREEFDKRGLLLMAAVAAVEDFAKLSYNVTAISSYLDLVSIMAYDMYGPWDSVTGHNSPLHKGEGDEHLLPESVHSVDVALQYWTKQGCPPGKLVLGLPLFGRTFLLSSDDSSVRAPSNGAGLAGPYTQTRGMIGYNEVVICYYGTWAAYRTGLGKFEVTDIPTDLCTHVVYTFLGIDYSGNVVSLDPYLDYADNWGKDYLRKFNALKITNPSLKTILAVGGFSEGSEKYSLMASNPKLRRNFITTSLNILTKYGFDGLEIDWEYPNRGDSIYGQGDVDNFSQLLKELREEFDKRGLLLMAAVAAVEDFAKLSYNVTAISSYLDLVSIMAYDMYGPWDSVTGHNSPLHKGEGDEHLLPESVHSVDVALQYWTKQGCPPGKLVLGLPLFGRTFLLSSDDSSVRAPSNGAGLAGPYTQTRGMIGYNEICHKLLTEPWEVRYDALAKVSYAVQHRNWVSYDDPTSLADKVEYGLQHGIAGVMVWSIETDDFHGICRDGDFPLLRTVNKALRRAN